MGAYSEYFLNSRQTVVKLELIEVSHPDFSQPYRIVRNAPNGVTVDLSPEETGVVFDYYPAAVESLGVRDDLEASLRINWGDLGEIIPQEMDRVYEAGGSQIKPVVRFWEFRSDQLGTPLYGPLYLEVPSIEADEQGSAFEARAPALNSTKTGERLTLDRIPMQRGFL